MGLGQGEDGEGRSQMKFWGQGLEAGKGLDTKRVPEADQLQKWEESQREDQARHWGKESVQAEDMAEPREKMGEKGHENKRKRGRYLISLHNVLTSKSKKSTLYDSL